MAKMMRSDFLKDVDRDAIIADAGNQIVNATGYYIRRGVYYKDVKND
jgi:hypothetical protein